MRTSYVLIGGLGLMLAACGQPHSSSPSGLRGGPAGPATGTGAPTAGTGTISPVQGQNSLPPSRNTPGTPSAGTGTIAPIQGQSDVGQGTVTRP